MEKDPYATLGVSKSATQEEIRNSYRKLAKTLHPDLNPGNKEAERKFKEVAAAYDILGDEKKRKAYDQGPKPETPFGGADRERHFYYETQGEPSGGSGFYSQDFNFEDLFTGSFSRRRARSGPIPGEDELYRMEVDLRDVAEGGEREIALPNGKRFRVKIPPGITDGTRLRFQGQGHPGFQGGPPGDLYIELTIRESPVFHRKGLDLEIELPVTLAEAMLGASVRVPTPTGQIVMTIPPGSSSESRLRARGKGLPDRAQSTHGDLFVRLRVFLPPILSDSLKKAVQENEKLHPYHPREEKSHAA